MGRKPPVEAEGFEAKGKEALRTSSLYLMDVVGIQKSYCAMLLPLSLSFPVIAVTVSYVINYIINCFF